MEYLEKLLSSEVFTTKEDFPKFKITDSGLYILHTTFDLTTISGESILKVGMTVSRKGLTGRLSQHFTNRYKSTVLGRHMSLDKTLGIKFGFDFSIQDDRKKFLKENCYFQVLPLKEFNWSNNEELKIKRRELKSVETMIEDTLRLKIRYIDDVIER